MPLFSVVIPAYNRAALIGATLESVFAQECRDFEVVVADDGSTDGTPDVVRGYGDRVRLVTQPNRGPGAARNLGIRHAAGRYVAFLDSDDLWFPWTLAVYAEVIARFDGPAFVAGTERTFADPADLRGVAREPTDARWYPDYLASCREPIWIGTCAAAVRADVLRAVGGYTDTDMNAEDSDLWLRLGAAPGFVHVRRPLVFAYRAVPGSATTDPDRTYRGILALIAGERAGRYPGGPARRLARWRVLTRHTRPVALGCLARGDLAGGRRIFAGTLGWNLRLGRARFVAGFALHYLRAAARAAVAGRRPGPRPAP